MSSAFKSTIYENGRIHDNQVHAYGHVHGRWKTKQRITLIPKLRSDRKLFWPPFCSCLCFRCLVRCILVGSTNPFLVPGSRERPGEMVEAFLQVFQPLCKAEGRTVIFLTRVSESSHANIFFIYISGSCYKQFFRDLRLPANTFFYLHTLQPLQTIYSKLFQPPSPVLKDTTQLVICSLFTWGARICDQVSKKKKKQEERKESPLALSLTSILVKLFCFQRGHKKALN